MRYTVSEDGETDARDALAAARACLGMTNMRIEAPTNFWSASDLPSRFASRDPRQQTFVDQEVEIDLRQCEFILPTAIMWCLVYLFLASKRGCTCRLLVPENMGTCVYLKSIGLFDLLKSVGVEVDDRGVFSTRRDTQVVLPLTRFSRSEEVEELANRTLEALNARGTGAANLRPLVSEAFAELALNAAEHAQSSLGAFGLIQFYQQTQGERFICVVADGGIGVRRSLERNPNLRDRIPYDWVALELATRERVSGTGQPTRGIGLFGVAEDMRKSGRQLVLHSGIGILTISEDVELESRRATLFPGTLAFASIPT